MGLFVAYRRIYRQSLKPFAIDLRPTGLKAIIQQSVRHDLVPEFEGDPERF